MPDTYIEQCINSRVNVKIYTTNGAQIDGCIMHDFMDYIVVKSGGKQKMVYKHAISTIEPL